MKTCKHSNLAVCKKIEDREFFKAILKTYYPEVIICKRVMYKITDGDNKTIKVLKSLDNISKGAKGYFIINMHTGEPIYLCKDNFKIVCPRGRKQRMKCKEREPYVVEYIPQQKKSG